MGNEHNQTLHWTKITYPVGIESADEVEVTPLTTTVPELGAWFDIQTVMYSSAKIYKDKLYAWAKIIQPQTPGAPDTMRIWSREDGSHRDLALNPILRAAMPPDCSAFFSHTFDVFAMNEVIYAVNIVQYAEKELNGAVVDGFVAFSTIDGSLLKTADGKSYFNMYKQA